MVFAHSIEKDDLEFFWFFCFGRQFAKIGSGNIKKQKKNFKLTISQLIQQLEKNFRSLRKILEGPFLP
jgi:hypothetical protein